MQPGESRLKRMLTGELAVRLLCGDNSPLYTALYEKQLIGRDFDTDYAIIPDGAAAVLGGESRDPETVREAILVEVRRLAQDGVDEALFRRMKRAIYGLHLRVCDVPDAYARQEVTALFSGEHYADFASLLASVTPADVQTAFRRWAQPGMRRHVGRSTQITQRKRRKMEHTIGFPNLGLEFTLNRVACTVLGKDIYWYGIIICAGFILAALYVSSRTKEFGITSDNLMDCLIICVPLGIICARIYYVVFEWSYYAEHPSEIIAIWKGGIAIYGGIIGTLIGLFVYSRVKKLSFASLCDLAAFGLLIGQWHRPLGQLRQRRGARRPDHSAVGHDDRRRLDGSPDVLLRIPLEPHRLHPAAFLLEKAQIQG